MRAAVLKMKDPRQIIRDMEKLDEMGKSPRVLVDIWVLLDAKVIHEIVLWPLVFIEIYSHSSMMEFLFIFRLANI